MLSSTRLFVCLQTDAGKTARWRCIWNRREGTGGWHYWKKRDSHSGCQDAKRFTVLI